jgi:putative flippase GtrA
MIPKIIHWCWFGHGQVPPMAQKCIRSWKEKLPDYEIKEWNEDNFDVNSVRYVSEAYQKRKFAFVTDYVRLYALYNEGGIYMDSDVEVLRRLDQFHGLPAFTGYESNGACITGIMGSEKRGRWVKDLMDEYQFRQFIRPDGTLDMTTNVKYTVRLMQKKGCRLDGTKEVLPGYVTIFPQDYFCPKSFKTKRITLTENTYTIHHFAASWWDARARCIHWTRRYLGARAADVLRYFWRPFPVVVHSLWASAKRKCRKLLPSCGEEFARYAVVGGIAFAADFGTMVLAQECLLKRFECGIYFSVMLGFFVGLIVNYVLSLCFVFTKDRYADKGRNVGSFLLFGIIGAAGLGWTELGMWLGVRVFSWNYMFVKILVTGAVLAWNYLGRKWLVFNGAKEVSE